MGAIPKLQASTPDSAVTEPLALSLERMRLACLVPRRPVYGLGLVPFHPQKLNLYGVCSLV